MEEKKVMEMQTEKAAEAAGEDLRENHEISETWAEETISDLDDFIESQGIYIRQ